VFARQGFYHYSDAPSPKFFLLPTFVALHCEFLPQCGNLDVSSSSSLFLCHYIILVCRTSFLCTHLSGASYAGVQISPREIPGLEFLGHTLRHGQLSRDGYQTFRVVVPVSTHTAWAALPASKARCHQAWVLPILGFANGICV
jgi:hypothetical protein